MYQRNFGNFMILINIAEQSMLQRMMLILVIFFAVSKISQSKWRIRKLCEKNTTKILRIIDGLLNKSFADIWYLAKQLQIKNNNHEFIFFRNINITRFSLSLKASDKSFGLQHFPLKKKLWFMSLKFLARPIRKLGNCVM